MLLKAKFPKASHQDGRFQALLAQNGWEPDLLSGEDDAGCWYQIAIVDSDQDPRVTARALLSPFVTIGHQPLETHTERIPLSVRLNALAEEVSRHDAGRAMSIYAMADELQDLR